MSDVTHILSAIEQGDARAVDELLPAVYDELRCLAAWKLSQERPGQKLQATALVHEAYIRLVGAENQNWKSRTHFFTAAAEAMRRILIENARRKQHLKHGGGTGEPNDPYQIATAYDLIALGETPEDYDKHFILTADIYVDPNLPGRKVFDKAVIAPDTNPVKDYYKGTCFTGVSDGNAHTISHLTIKSDGYLGLFGQLFSGKVKYLGLVDVNITGPSDYIGGRGRPARCGPHRGQNRIERNVYEAIV